LNLLVDQIKQSLSYLDKRDKSRLMIAILGQILLALLDMAGAAILGFIGVISAVSITDSPLPNSISRVEELLKIENQDVTKQVTILGIIVIAIFVSKTIGSLYLNRRVLNFLATKQVQIAGDIWKKVLKSDYLSITRYPQQELIQAVTDSLNIAIIGILGNLMLAVSELILLAFLLVLLSIVYPSMALISLLSLGTLAYITQRKIGMKTQKLNAEYSRAAVASKTSLVDSLAVLSEIRVSGNSSYFINRFRTDRTFAADAYVKSLWLGQIPKYILEFGLVLSGTFLFFFTQATSTSVDAIGKIVVFLAVSGRLIPSIIRLQSHLIGLHSNTGTSQSINVLVETLSRIHATSAPNFSIDSENSLHKNLETPIDIIFEKVNFSYQEDVKIFDFGNLHIQAGRSVAVIGKSGVGKTTLVQLILGLTEPSSGKVTLNKKSPIVWMESNLGSVSYLPQAVTTVSGNIAENIALGVVPELIDDSKIRLALKIAALDNWVESLPLALRTTIGDNGLRLSGGQLQRIGIARAVYKTPSLIVLDEPTSSLDQETEKTFLNMLTLLHGKSTIVMITHKLDLLEHVDDIILVEEEGYRVTARLIDPKSVEDYMDKSIFED
jgi:ABC-type multidrug transport system fused ATPase/permease subunit